MSFMEQIEESPAKLIAIALTVNLILLSWILDGFLQTNLIAFSLHHPDGDIQQYFQQNENGRKDLNFIMYQKSQEQIVQRQISSFKRR